MWHSVVINTVKCCRASLFMLVLLRRLVLALCRHFCKWVLVYSWRKTFLTIVENSCNALLLSLLLLWQNLNCWIQLGEHCVERLLIGEFESWSTLLIYQNFQIFFVFFFLFFFRHSCEYFNATKAQRWIYYDLNY